MSSSFTVVWWVLSLVTAAVLVVSAGLTWYRLRRRNARSASERRNEVIRAMFTVLSRPALDATDIAFFYTEPQITRDVTIALGELSMSGHQEKFTALAIQSGFASWLSSEARWGKRGARLLALRALAFVGGDISSDTLRAALSERNPETRQVAIAALDDRDQLTSVPGLVGLIAASLNSGRSLRLSELFARRSADDRHAVSLKDEGLILPDVKQSQSTNIDRIAV
jgi:hypothetical protein